MLQVLALSPACDWALPMWNILKILSGLDLLFYEVPDLDWVASALIVSTFQNITTLTLYKLNN